MSRQTWLRRTLRCAPWSRNPLLRATDRINGLAAVIAVAAALVAIPAAAMAGVSAGADAAARVRAAPPTRFAVTATVTDRPQTGSGNLLPQEFMAPAVWGPCPTCGSGPIAAGRYPRPGDRVQVWVDPQGRPTGSRADDPGADGIAYGLCVLSAGWLGAAVLAFGCRFLLDRRRRAVLDQEWRQLSRSGDTGGR